MEETAKAELMGRASGLSLDKFDTTDELRRLLWGDLVAVAIVTCMVIGLTAWAISGI